MNFVYLNIFSLGDHRVLSIPAAFYPLDISGLGVERLRNVIERLNLRIFVIDVSYELVR